MNNIAWIARRLPVVGVPRGEFGVRPIHVEDLARLAVEQGASDRDAVLDAVGPETFGYRDFVARIARAVGARPGIVAMPRGAVLAGAKVLGLATGDVVLAREEVGALAENLLVTGGPPTGSARFTDWLATAAPALGREWFHELRRNYRVSP